MSNLEQVHEDLKKSYQELAEQKKKMEFLHEIDSYILEREVDIDFFNNIIKKVYEYSFADLAYIFISGGKDLLFLNSYPELNNIDPIPFDEEQFIKGLNEQLYIYEKIHKTEEIAFPILYENSLRRIIFPIMTSTGVWGIIGIESKKEPENIDNTIDFLKGVRRQVEVAINYDQQKNKNRQRLRIQEEFFVKELDFNDSLEAILHHIVKALPSIGPLEISPLPEIQILFYREDSDFLTIKATTGSERIDTRVSVKESISGIVIEKPEIPFINDDPRKAKFKGKYKSYLGKKDAGEPAKEIRSELVIQLKFNNRIIGVINFESANKDAFKTRHVEAMLELAEEISPIINGLQKRIEKINLQDQASTYAMKKFLNRIAETFLHKVRNPTYQFSLSFGLIKKTGRSDKYIDFVKSEELFNICEDGINQISSSQEDFAKRMESYLDFDFLSINTIIRQAIGDFGHKNLKQNKIDIVFDPAEDFNVFCSPFFREHIFNIINNSIDSIKKKRLKSSLPEDYRGKITIKTEPFSDEESQDINRQCKITILDNGKGAKKEDLDKIGEGRFTTKGKFGGTGYGLSAAKHYLRSVGGKMDRPNSVENEFFEVIMYLDIYSENRKKDNLENRDI